MRQRIRGIQSCIPDPSRHQVGIFCSGYSMYSMWLYAQLFCTGILCYAKSIIYIYIFINNSYMLLQVWSPNPYHLTTHSYPSLTFLSLGQWPCDQACRPWTSQYMLLWVWIIQPLVVFTAHCCVKCGWLFTRIGTNIDEYAFKILYNYCDVSFIISVVTESLKICDQNFFPNVHISSWVSGSLLSRHGQ